MKRKQPRGSVREAGVRAPTTRSRIITAARRAFAAGGYDAASMSAIARLARIDKSSLYYFFRNKEDLFAAVTLDTWLKLAASMKKNLDLKTGASGRHVLAGACRDFISIALRAGMSMTRMELPKRNDPSFAKIITAIRDNHSRTREFLRRHGITRPDVAHSLIFNAVHSFVLHAAAGKPQPPVKQYCEYLAAIVLPE